MYQENLFELIRKEEVIIWAGAGLSMYAGYPSGKRLGEILIENLSKSERGYINENLLLPDLAEEFYRLKGNNRNALIRILRQTFSSINPTSTECHNYLATVPHIKNIITTNYDTLIEDAYKSKGQVILSSKLIPYLEKDKVNIFKVHGDLSEPDSIIITKSDYNNFFKNNSENDVYWTVVKERLSTKSVLFLGYNLEDPNVSVIFDRITDALGTNRKEAFLVAPNLHQHKISDLVKKGIHYINKTAEQLIEELIQNIKENIIGDLEKGQISADTFRDFLAELKLLPNLRADNNKFKLHSLQGVSEEVDGKINFSVKNDPSFIKELEEFVSGNNIGDFEIPEHRLSNVDIWYGGLKFPSSDTGKLMFKSIPKIDTSIDVRFEDGSDYTEIPVKLFTSRSATEAHITLKTAKLNITLHKSTSPPNKFNFSYKHSGLCKNVKDEIEQFTLLKNLGEGKRFTIFTKDGAAYSHTFPVMPPLLEEAEAFLDYFNNLKLIEQHFNVRFSDIPLSSITQSTYERVLVLLAVIRGEPLEQNWNKELVMKLDGDIDQGINQLKMINELGAPVVAQDNTVEETELHGQNITLGYKHIAFIEPYVTNLEAIIQKQEQVVKIRSKKNKLLLSYSRTQD